MHTTLFDQIVDERVEQAVAARVEQAVAARVEQAVAARVERAVTEGREEGRTEGREEGVRLLLRRLLTDRFGALPPTLEARIAAGNGEMLTALFERALHATSVDALG